MVNEASRHLVEQLWGGGRAEYEAPWLASVYVRPALFDTLIQPYPCLLFGESGSGKSALRLMLADQVRHTGKIVVTWKPSPPRQEVEKPMVYWYLHQALHTCAVTLLREIAQHPARFEGIANWAQTVIGDFLTLYFQGAWPRQIERLLDETSAAAEPVLQALMNHSLSLVPDSTDELQMITEVIAALKPMGVEGIWMMVDGLEPWAEGESQVQEQFRVFLSTLALFEEPGFIFKVMAPLSLRPILLTSGGVLRRRLEPHHLKWTVGELVKVLNARFVPLQLAPPPFFAELMQDETLQAKVREQGGGETPRGWLRALAPSVREYVAHPDPPSGGAVEPLVSRILPLRLDQVEEQVFIGQRLIETLTPSSYKLLAYLYGQRPRICTRAELYYRLYKNLDYVPRSSADEGWDKPSDWRSMIDTALSRLRDAIEPTDDTQFYLVTVRGKGIKLENVE